MSGNGIGFAQILVPVVIIAGALLLNLPKFYGGRGVSLKDVQLRDLKDARQGEAIRLLLEETGTPYQDIRFETDDWVNNHKSKTSMYAFNELPQLSSEGKSIVQSGAILRYIARATGLYGANDWDATQCDIVALGAEALDRKYNALVSQKDYNTKKKELGNQFARSTLVPSYTQFEAWIQNNGAFYGRGNYVVGDDVTFADLALWAVVHKCQPLATDLLRDYPLLASWYDRIKSRPKIKAYLASSRAQ